MFKNLIKYCNSTLRDTFSSQYHSKDFIFARSEYLRTRITTISLIFVLLTPFWALFDWLLLPPDSREVILPARGIMFAGLLLTLFISKTPNNSTKKNLLLSGTTLALPALFYAVVLCELSTINAHSLIGYSFIPFLLVGTLSIFPFTLIESLVLGLGLLILQFFSGFVMEASFSPANLQNLWLLTALLAIVMTSNHFHLSLLLRLYRQATHDPLTGLLNRVALERHTTHIEQSDPKLNTTITLLDLDHFKLINDRYGHSIGDKVLRLFSALLKKEAKKNEVICRYGGEEFLIISTDTPKAEAMQRAEQIRQLTQKLSPKDLDQMPFSISVSQGISLLRPNESIENAIQRADERLYMAKENGRNCIVAAD